jgi:hypothetical protein
VRFGSATPSIWSSSVSHLVVASFPHARAHVVSVDTVAYVWWYDNEGVIRSDGIDFIDDLPYFLVLLLCFERFTPKNWGIVSDLKPKGLEVEVSLLPFTKISIKKKIRDHYGIVGRATQLLEATSQSSDPRNLSESLGGKALVFKVYWPETSRASEVEIIEKARDIARESKDVEGHLPDLVYSHDFVEYSTKEIRTAFGIHQTETKSTRVLRVILFRRLYPITDLTGDDFWKAFWECFRCKCIRRSVVT